MLAECLLKKHATYQQVINFSEYIEEIRYLRQLKVLKHNGTTAKSERCCTTS